MTDHRTRPAKATWQIIISCLTQRVRSLFESKRNLSSSTSSGLTSCHIRQNVHPSESSEITVSSIGAPSSAHDDFARSTEASCRGQSCRRRREANALASQ